MPVNEIGVGHLALNIGTQSALKDALADHVSLTLLKETKEVVWIVCNQCARSVKPNLRREIEGMWVVLCFPNGSGIVEPERVESLPTAVRSSLSLTRDPIPYGGVADNGSCMGRIKVPVPDAAKTPKVEGFFV